MADIQKDLVLSINEYAFVRDETKGNVTVWVGPCKTSLSTSDRLVNFNTKTKKFEDCNYSDAISLFATAPENWYIALKNPAAENKHPNPGAASTSPEKMLIGQKINVRGPVSFALYPGQMAKVIKGHTLRSNQYLLARVYDADKLNENKSETEELYVNGQILVIKGTETPFYIPPTGIEVIPVNNDSNKGYVREAVTLERLEYCILKDEDGNKRYIHGPKVVFPKPTEVFVSKDNSVKYRAIELSEISGVYVKVIADYEENNKKYHVGDELFITGKDQMIYYPRPEHTFIKYDDKIKYHAIAIPTGAGRYIMNRLTGEIKTVKGPAMYLPDPRTEVVVQRTLSKRECELWFPGNKEVLEANGHYDTNIGGYTTMGVSKGINNVKTRGWDTNATWAAMDCATASLTSCTIPTAEYTELATLNETDGSGLSRGNKFTPPRSISFKDTKYQGAVAMDIWTGYAINIISKDGTRKVVCGPQSILLDYDQTLDSLAFSTGKPKTANTLLNSVFLRHENNRITDIITVETEDYVTCDIKVSYIASFDKAVMDKWFSVDNYVKQLCDWGRAAIAEKARKHNIMDFYANYHSIVRTALSESANEEYLHYFDENGLMLQNVEVLNITIDGDIQTMIDRHQEEIISENIRLIAETNSAETQRKILKIELENRREKDTHDREIAQLRYEASKKQAELTAELNRMKEEEERLAQTATLELQGVLKKIESEKIERENAIADARAKAKKDLDELEIAKQTASANNMVAILQAIGPDLAAAMNAENNQATLKAIAEAISPYAIANGDSIANAVDTLLRGSPMGSIIEQTINND